jgi:hypothetical protein
MKLRDIWNAATGTPLKRMGIGLGIAGAGTLAAVFAHSHNQFFLEGGFMLALPIIGMAATDTIIARWDRQHKEEQQNTPK